MFLFFALVSSFETVFFKVSIRNFTKHKLIMSHINTPICKVFKCIRQQQKATIVKFRMN